MEGQTSEKIWHRPSLSALDFLPFSPFNFPFLRFRWEHRPRKRRRRKRVREKVELKEAISTGSQRGGREEVPCYVVGKSSALPLPASSTSWMVERMGRKKKRKKEGELPSSAFSPLTRTRREERGSSSRKPKFLPCLPPPTLSCCLSRSLGATARGLFCADSDGIGRMEIDALRSRSSRLSSRIRHVRYGATVVRRQGGKIPVVLSFLFPVRQGRG